MKLLIVTQSVDREDPNLGAFYYWFEELARQCEQVVILASRASPHTLPGNVEVHTFGATTRLGRIWKFWEVFSREYAGCDAVLFHQIPEFVLAAAPFLIARRRPSALWYAHKSVTPALKMAERLVTYIFTSSAEGFRLPSKKVLWVGQAINMEFFSPGTEDKGKKSRGGIRLITVGRIAPVKNYELIIDALVALGRTKGPQWTLDVVGGPIMPRDVEYAAALKRRAEEAGLTDRIHFLGSRAYSEIPSLLREHDIFLNMSQTGSLDKAVLEAMSCGLSVITANEAYRAFLPQQYFLEKAEPALLAERIRMLADETRPNAALRQIVQSHHDMRHTMEKMISVLKG